MKRTKNRQAHNSTGHSKNDLARLYVQIPKDLELKMLKLIYETKSDPMKKKILTKKEKINKRTIVEEALEEYFERRGM